ncbi:ABC transporter ATP-binding protein [Mycolicibacterium nivoides]|uniref:ABC transporter ATP-binding protein n=1 Tax=Mycolicibacterium nivoides TaxID=2487344 RepID=UPI003C2B4E4B
MTGGHVVFDGVGMHYGEHEALTDFSLEIACGEFVALLGPSGSGKTTALRLLAGLEKPTAGRILVDGTEITAIPSNKRDFGMVFQSYSLFPHMTAVHNVEYGLRARRRDRRTARVEALAGLDLVGLVHLAERYPHQLSGGEQQRVALARALVTEPRVLLLDESLSALDAQVRVRLRQQIRELQRRLMITSIFVTHDQEEALSIADRVAVLHDGRIAQVGTPQDLYHRPQTAFVAEFVGQTNTLPGRITRPGYVEVLDNEHPVSGEAAHAGVEVEVYVRPERLLLAADGHRGTATGTSFLGSFSRTSVQLNGSGSMVLVQHPSDHALPQGSEVFIQIVPGPLTVREHTD